MKLTTQIITNRYARYVMYLVTICISAALISLLSQSRTLEQRPDIANMNKATNDYYKKADAEEKAFRELYANDAGGADTPEEALDIYIESLHTQKYEAAVGVYDPEFREKELATIKEESKEDPVFGLIYRAYTTQKIESYPVTNGHEIEFKLPNQEYPWTFRFYKNPFTKKWYITKFR